jgi:hypothetical protein
MNMKRFKNWANYFKINRDPEMKSAGIFKKTVSAAQRTFNKSNIKNDLSVRVTRATGAGIAKGSKWVGGKILIGANMVGSTPAAKKLGQGVRAVARHKATRWTGKATLWAGGRSFAVGKALAMPSLITVGAVGMLGVSVMNGANNAAKDIIFERYMADQRFARDMLLQSRLGTAIGTARMNKYGSTVGLSNSLSRTRHGASY